MNEARRAAMAEAVLKARNGRVYKGFGRYLGWFFAGNFRAVRVDRAGWPSLPPDEPALIYTNHPSWWDPITFVLVATRLFPDRPCFGPMDAAALETYRFMRMLGIFGIDPATAEGARQFLAVGGTVLSRPGHMLWVTAEGAFTDVRRRPVTLRPGIAHLAASVEGAVTIPLAMEYVFWNERHPELLLRFGDPEPTGVRWGGPKPLLARLADRLTRTMDGLAEAAISRDPGRFATLVVGRTGVGGAYDTWRRLKAWSQGRRFDGAHEPGPPNPSAVAATSDVPETRPGDRI